MCQSKCNTATKAGEVIKMKSDEILALKRDNASLAAQVSALHREYEGKLAELLEISLENQALIRQVSALHSEYERKRAQRTN